MEDGIGGGGGEERKRGGRGENNGWVPGWPQIWRWRKMAFVEGAFMVTACSTHPLSFRTTWRMASLMQDDMRHDRPANA